MNTIYDGSFVLGQTSATNFIAGPGITIDSPSAGTVRIGNDETVLYSGNTNISTGALSEDWRNFEYIRVCFAEQASLSDAAYRGGQLVADLDVQQCLDGYNNRSACMGMSLHDLTTNYPIGLRVGICYMTGPTTFSSYHIEKSTNSTATANNIGNMWVSKVIGYNRKEV